MISKRTQTETIEQDSRSLAPMIDEAIEVKLGTMLRHAFSDVFDAPLPERFRGLIEQLAGGDER